VTTIYLKTEYIHCYQNVININVLHTIDNAIHNCNMKDFFFLKSKSSDSLNIDNCGISVSSGSYPSVAKFYPQLSDSCGLFVTAGFNVKINLLETLNL
jgi:hypothetical protein